VDPEALERGVAALRALGFDVRLTDSIVERSAFMAGTVARRRSELNGLFSDPAIRGIVCARGGAGAAWLLPLLDPEALRRNPKVFVGYSDITFLHLLLHRQGLVTFHGPMAAREIADGMYDPESFWWAITGDGAPYANADLAVLHRGRAEGRLRGGCLSILAAAAGTPWAFRADAEGTILFLEDIDERPYRIDRLLFQLRVAGAFEGVRGIVFGEMKGCGPSPNDAFTLESVVLEALAGLEVPVAWGLSSGHTDRPCVTLPLGVRARLECAASGRFEVLEAAVAS
jgi:muramoyltetrapeptide carboxypeptidase